MRSSRDDPIGLDAGTECDGIRPVAAGEVPCRREPAMNLIRHVLESWNRVDGAGDRFDRRHGGDGRSIAAGAGRARGQEIVNAPNSRSVSIAALAADDSQASDLIVHEWGTFLGMNGSDGTSLDGMYHEEHALPSFVHSRARDQLRLPIDVPQGGDAGDLLLYAEARERPGRRGIPAGHLDAVVSAGRASSPLAAGAGRAARPT